MTTVDQQTRQQICDLVNTCGGYWELRGIGQERREEMRLELRQHLEQAVRDGKSLEAVVGPNALALAESWARETPHHVSSGLPVILRWLLLDWLPFALALVAMLAVSQHLISLSASFTFTVEKAIVSFGFIGLFTLLQAVSGFLSPRIKSRDNRLLLAFCVYAVICVLVLVVLNLTHVPVNVVLFRWDWPVTLLVVVGALGLLGVKIWLNRRGQGERGNW